MQALLNILKLPGSFEITNSQSVLCLKRFLYLKINSTSLDQIIRRCKAIFLQILSIHKIIIVNIVMKDYGLPHAFNYNNGSVLSLHLVLQHKYSL